MTHHTKEAREAAAEKKEIKKLASDNKATVNCGDELTQ